MDIYIKYLVVFLTLISYILDKIFKKKITSFEEEYVDTPKEDIPKSNLYLISNVNGFMLFILSILSVYVNFIAK